MKKLLQLMILLGIVTSLEASVVDQPMVRIDSSGNKVAVWESSSGSMAIIQAATKGALDITWNTPVTISDPLKQATTPRMSMSKTTGDVVVVWIEDTVSGRGLGATQLPFGGSWSAPVGISDVNHDISFEDYQVQVNNAGSNVIIYKALDLSTSQTKIYATEATIGFGWSPPQAVSGSIP